MKKTWIAVAAIATIGVVGYFWWKNFSFTDKIDWEVKGHSLRFTGFTNGRVEIYVNVTSQLPTATITGYDIDLFINNKFIAKAKSDQRQTLERGKVSRLVIASDFDPLKITGNVFNLQLLKDIIKNKLNTTFTTKGSINVEIAGVEVKSIPVDVTMTLAEMFEPTPPEPEKP